MQDRYVCVCLLACLCVCLCVCVHVCAVYLCVYVYVNEYVCAHAHVYQCCNWVESSGLSGLFGSLFPGQSGHTYMPDTDQNYLVIMCIENCNEKIDTL